MDYDDTWFVLCFTACHKTTNNDYRWVNFTGDYLRLFVNHRQHLLLLFFIHGRQYQSLWIMRHSLTKKIFMHSRPTIVWHMILTADNCVAHDTHGRQLCGTWYSRPTVVWHMTSERGWWSYTAKVVKSFYSKKHTIYFPWLFYDLNTN